MICNRVAILNKGRVVRTGTISELTTQKLVYVIQLSVPISENLQAQLKQSPLPIEYRGTNLIVTLNDKSDLNSIIDVLRANSVGIEGMTQQKTSLEDYFIQLVKGENAQ
jgi:ABC-type multidrug transport system ATPase subunit